MATIKKFHCFDFWRAVLAEFIGTGLLVLLACGSTIFSAPGQSAFYNGMLAISLSFGLTVATVVWCIADISGGHVNPAVTFGMLVAGKMNLLRGVAFIVAQCLGAITGAAYLDAVTPSYLNSTLGANSITEDFSIAQAFGVEAAITFVLVLTVCASCDKGRSLGGSAPLSIGIAVSIGHLFSVSRILRYSAVVIQLVSFRFYTVTAVI